MVRFLMDYFMFLEKIWSFFIIEVKKIYAGEIEGAVLFSVATMAAAKVATFNLN